MDSNQDRMNNFRQKYLSRQIIVELDESGLVAGVYCPDETYTVNVLDYRDWCDVRDDSVDKYYSDLEKEIENLKDCY